MLQLISEINAFVWGPPMLSMIIASGAYLSFKTRFFQIRKVPSALKSVFSSKNGRSDDKGVSSAGAVCTALAATMGTGNIAGVAGAISIGGPGAVFWMWISAVFSAAVKLFEAVLSVMFREKNDEGFVGGPMYYIKLGLPRRFMPLAFLFSAFGLVAVFGTGNMAQVNTMAAAVGSMLSEFGANASVIGKANIFIGIFSALLAGTALIGGAKRIGNFATTLVPLMSIIYITLCIGVILKNISSVPYVFLSIIKGAFCPSAVTGGAVGTMALSIKTGFSRGVFSNEAGLGTAPMAYASANDENPITQGLSGIFEVFADTIVVCTLTAFAVLCAGTTTFGSEAGAQNVLNAFSSVFGQGVSVIFCIVVCFFGFSSCLGWGYYGIRCAEFLMGRSAKIPFLLIFCLGCILGAVIRQDTVWELSGALNGLMAIPNITAVILLSKNATVCIREYDKFHS